jgi:hypothetical protein
MPAKKEDGNIVEYGAYTPEAAEEEHDALGKASGGQFMKLEVGRNVIRILPPPPGRNTPFVTTYQHFINLPGREPIVFNCPRMMERRQCPACMKADKLRSSANSMDQDAARDFWASRRVFCAVIDRADQDAGPKVLGFGKTVHEALVAIRRDEDAGGDFTDPAHGFDIIVERVGTGKMDTRYKVMPARKSSPLGKHEWITAQPNLRALAGVPSWEEIVGMVKGGSDDGEDSDGGGRTAQDDVARDVVGDADGTPAGGREPPF